MYRPCIGPVQNWYRADTVKRYRPCTKNATKTYRAGTGVRYRAVTVAGIGPLQGQYRNVSWVYPYGTTVGPYYSLIVRPVRSRYCYMPVVAL